ncbi:MAG: hypothetical protein FWH53_04105 [Leptospirales bacterium]|nr:hypothetical protein [Leptospirales bacterium]
MKNIEAKYLERLRSAQVDAKKEAEDDLSIVNCPFCGEKGTAVKRGENRIDCYFCDETDYEVECCRCGLMDMISEMVYFDETENGDSLYLCQHCNDMFESDD